jgi:hypothetical protein
MKGSKRLIWARKRLQTIFKKGGRDSRVHGFRFADSFLRISLDHLNPGTLEPFIEILDGK